ncbi:MAG: hypothetical protein U9Q99_01655, partial [Nanoarchaeota archaeon]|nr:hypothetical protein [Nanoarchaeota archaeon]
QPLTVADIVAFVNNPSDDGIRFEINKWWYNSNMEKIKMLLLKFGLEEQEEEEEQEDIITFFQNMIGAEAAEAAEAVEDID